TLQIDLHHGCILALAPMVRPIVVGVNFSSLRLRSELRARPLLSQSCLFILARVDYFPRQLAGHSPYSKGESTCLKLISRQASNSASAPSGSSDYTTSLSSSFFQTPGTCRALAW